MVGRLLTTPAPEMATSGRRGGVMIQDPRALIDRTFTKPSGRPRSRSCSTRSAGITSTAATPAATVGQATPT